MKIAQVVLVAVATIVGASAAHAAVCLPVPTAFKIDVREAPIVMHGELGLAELKAMSAQLRRSPPHEVLGFYVGTVGYALEAIEVVTWPSAGSADPACPRLEIQAELVVVDRRIAVASDLSTTPCRLRAAVEHYRRHAAAASRALHQFATELPRVLGPEVDRYLRSRPGAPQPDDADVRRYVGGLLDHAVEVFSASLGKVQADVDTPDEVRKLSAPCGNT